MNGSCRYDCSTSCVCRIPSRPMLLMPSKRSRPPMASNASDTHSTAVAAQRDTREAPACAASGSALAHSASTASTMFRPERSLGINLPKRIQQAVTATAPTTILDTSGRLNLRLLRRSFCRNWPTRFAHLRSYPGAIRHSNLTLFSNEANTPYGAQQCILTIDRLVNWLSAFGSRAVAPPAPQSTTGSRLSGSSPTRCGSMKHNRRPQMRPLRHPSPLRGRDRRGPARYDPIALADEYS